MRANGWVIYTMEPNNINKCVAYTTAMGCEPIGNKHFYIDNAPQSETPENRPELLEALKLGLTGIIVDPER